MMPVDVVLLTKNSERLLERCLTSVYENALVARLIVIDGYSIDNTLTILQEFNEKYHNVEIIFDGGTRASARQKGIENVRTPWFLFIDSDVVLCKDWYKKAAGYINVNVGAVWGTEVWSTIKNPRMLKLFLIVTRKIFEVRGGTHDTLIRTELVRDIQIPKNLHVFEDAYIKNWINKKGFLAVACYSPFCIHFRPSSVWTFKGSLGLVNEALRLGSPGLTAKLLFAYGFYTFYSVYQLVLENKKA
jgi:glycosyltransferase involved in cell wall biosynthesis